MSRILAVSSPCANRGGVRCVLQGWSGRFELEVCGRHCRPHSTCAAREATPWTTCCACRALSHPFPPPHLLQAGGTEEADAKKQNERRARRMEREKLALGMRRNINDKLPKNVPY